MNKALSRGFESLSSRIIMIRRITTESRDAHGLRGRWFWADACGWGVGMHKSQTQAQGCTACAMRQLDMLDWKDEKTTKRLDCSTTSMLPSSDYTSCRRTDRESVPVPVLSSRRPEAMSITYSCAVGVWRKMVNYFVTDNFWQVISSILYLMWKPSVNGACLVCNNMEFLKNKLMICGSSSGTSEFNHGNSTTLCWLVFTQRRICANRFFSLTCLVWSSLWSQYFWHPNARREHDCQIPCVKMVTTISDKIWKLRSTNWHYMHKKKHSESANPHHALFEEREAVYSSVKQCSLLLLVSISWKFHECPSIRYSVMLPANTDPENRKKNPVSKGLNWSSLKCTRLLLVS